MLDFVLRLVGLKNGGIAGLMDNSVNTLWGEKKLPPLSNISHSPHTLEGK